MLYKHNHNSVDSLLLATSLGMGGDRLSKLAEAANPVRTSRLGRALRMRRAETISSLVQEELEGMIMTGELGGGDRINETVLAERFEISRGPIREACRGLEAAGLVRIVPNRGVFVRELDASEALDLYDIRASLFGLAGKSAARRITEPQIEALQAIVDRLQIAVDAGDINAFYPLNVELHACLVDYSGNAHLASLFPAVDKQLHLFRRRGLVQPGQMDLSNEEHRAILDALRARDADRSAALMEAHILAGKQRLLARLGASEDDVRRRPPDRVRRAGHSNGRAALRGRRILAINQEET